MPDKPPMTDFYQENSRFYFSRTVAVDPAPFLSPFVRHLKAGATVLDIGCGSGRDLLWLNERGFRPTGLERSPGLAELAGRHSGCNVIAGDFESFDFSSLAVDAVMACGSLVHVPHERLTALVKRILAALKGTGIVYISLKQGQGRKSDKFGRVFYLWETTRLGNVWRDTGLSILHLSGSQSALNAKDDWLAYVLKKG
jgi:SAM-dependent methyltransferase